MLTEAGYHFIKRGELILGELNSLEDSTRLIAMGLNPRYASLLTTSSRWRRLPICYMNASSFSPN